MKIGHVEAIFRYPVKSMGGDRLEAAGLGWHGIDGDRRLAFRRIDDRSGFPWLTAGKLPDLLLFTPQRREHGGQQDLPTHVRTPDGEEMAVFGEELAAEVGRRHGAPVQMMQLNHGIFDDAKAGCIVRPVVGRQEISPDFLSAGLLQNARLRESQHRLAIADGNCTIAGNRSKRQGILESGGNPKMGPE